MHFTNRTLSCGVAVIAVPLLLASCSSSGSSGPKHTGGSTATTTTASSATQTPPLSTPATSSAAPGAVVSAPISDAAAARDTLLAQASGAPIANGSPTGWQGDTSVHFVGSAVVADPTSVSGFQFVTSKEKSVDFLAFAVADSNGACAAGLLLSDASYTNVAKASAVPLPAGAACTSDAATAAAGY